MRNFIEEKIENLTDDELKQCFKNIQEYNTKGVMGNTLVRRIRNEFAKEINDNSWDRGCTIVVIPNILYEIAKRHYKNEDNKEIEADII